MTRGLTSGRAARAHPRRGRRSDARDPWLGLSGVILLASLELTLLSRARADVPFLRGDVNQDGAVSIADVQIYDCIPFFCWELVPCMDAADADDNGQIQFTDLVRILNIIFLGTGTIPAPFP